MFSKSALVAVAMLGASLVEAHSIMVEPVPYSFKPWDNSPISADGSDFPCRTTDYTVTQENYMAKGETQYLKFQGGATHGGGSCQISITSDRAPTKDTQWSVIKSIEGGCMDPSEGANNMSDQPGQKNPFSPGFTIPASFEPGQYTLAWTWFNRIGVREMYMNCAPITVTGGSSSKRSETVGAEKRATEEYPPMFIANVNGCKTKETKSPRFPNPGANVESYNEANLIGADENVCKEGAPTWGDAGYNFGVGSAPQPTVSVPASTSTAEPSSALPSESPISLGVTVAVPEFTPKPTQGSEPGIFIPTPSVIESVAPAPTSAPAPETSSPSSSSGGLSGPCTEEGLWNCIGGSFFQRCASGSWTEVQQLSSGTECTSGQGQDFAVKATNIKSRMLKEKRSWRRSHGHLHA